MTYRRAQAALFTLLVALPSIVVLPSVQAPSYSLTVSPQYTQEANSPGVTLSLNVAGAPAAQHDFEWIVLDPSGSNKNALSSSVGSQSSFTISVVYPANFGGGTAIGSVGRYNVTVIQTNPGSPTPVASGGFDVGLTDGAVYTRTSAVSLKATSYSPGEAVTINIVRGGTPAPNFPIPVLADSNGDVAYAWRTAPSTLTGNYTVTLNGSTTPTKSPQDAQTFRVQSASIGVTVVVPSPTLTPGQILTVSANANYPDSTSLTQGTVTATLSTSGFQIGSQLSLGFNQSQGMWLGSYTIKENDPTGVWLVNVTVSDPYGNSGQGGKSASVMVPPPTQSPINSFWFLTILGAGGVGALMGFLFLKRKRITRHRLQVDLQAVGREANLVKNQEFFMSVQRQLERMRNEQREKKNG